MMRAAGRSAAARVATQTPTGDDPMQPDVVVFGHRWYARDSDFRGGGPQYNRAWSRGNVALARRDAVLTLSNPTGTSPAGAELISRETFGYGTYRVRASADFANLPAGVVFGIFTFDWTATGRPTGFNEIDVVEVSQWNKGLPVTATATWYRDDGTPVTLGEAVWPTGKKDLLARLDFAPSSLRVRIYAGDERTAPILDRSGSGTLVPPHRKEAVHLNLWNGQWRGVPAHPNAVPETSVTVTGFHFEPGVRPPVRPRG